MMKIQKDIIFHHYCLLRQDLPFGVLCAQLVHAAGESNPNGIHSHAVALFVENEEKMAAIEIKLLENNISHIAVREPDSPYNNALMAIGINPTIRSKNKKLRKIVTGLPLIK